MSVPRAQRRHRDREHVEPVEVLAQLAVATAASGLRLVAASTRTSALMGVVVPTR